VKALREESGRAMRSRFKSREGSKSFRDQRAKVHPPQGERNRNTGEESLEELWRQTRTITDYL
jgi:hypothetical protein